MIERGNDYAVARKLGLSVDEVRRSRALILRRLNLVLGSLGLPECPSYEELLDSLEDESDVEGLARIVAG